MWSLKHILKCSSTEVLHYGFQGLGNMTFYREKMALLMSIPLENGSATEKLNLEQVKSSIYTGVKKKNKHKPAGPISETMGNYLQMHV